jgi:hypothetical protein
MKKNRRPRSFALNLCFFWVCALPHRRMFSKLSSLGLHIRKTTHDLMRFASYLNLSRNEPTHLLVDNHMIL